MKRKSSLIAKEVDSDLMLYNPEIDEVHILNPTGKAIYKLLHEGKTSQEIEEELRNHFVLEKGHNLIRDIEECIASFKEKGLIDENTSK